MLIFFNMKEKSFEKRIKPETWEDLGLGRLKEELERLEKEGGQEKSLEVIKEHLERLKRDSVEEKTIAKEEIEKEKEALRAFDLEKKVEFLVAMVFEEGRKGLMKAISIVERLGDPALIDRFHDELAKYINEILKA